MAAGGSKDLLGALLCLLFGAALDPPKAPLHQVAGTVGEPALFPLNITSGKTVLAIKWDLHPRRGTPFELAVLRNGQLRTSNRKDMDRIEVLNETTLCIKALKENETGILKSQVTYTTYVVDIFWFNLTVSDPTPEKDLSDVPTISQSEGKWWKTLVFLAVAVAVAGLRFWHIVLRSPERGTRDRRSPGRNEKEAEEERQNLHRKGL